MYRLNLIDLRQVVERLREIGPCADFDDTSPHRHFKAEWSEEYLLTRVSGNGLWHIVLDQSARELGPPHIDLVVKVFNHMFGWKEWMDDEYWRKRNQSA